MEDFDVWSNRQKERRDFENWGASRPPSVTDEGRRASGSDLDVWTERSEGTKILSRNRTNERKRSAEQSAKTSYSPPYVGAGDAARIGERADRRQWRKQGGERVAATWDFGLSATKEQNPLVATGVEHTQTQPVKQAQTTQQAPVRQAQPAFTNYSAPFVGAGESARTGIEQTQPTQPTQPVQSEKKTTTPASRRGGITLHPGMKEVDWKAKAAQSQAAVTPAASSPTAEKSQPQVKAPFTPIGQSARLGETNAPESKLSLKSQLHTAPGNTAADKTEGLALTAAYDKAKAAEQRAKNEAYRAIRGGSEDLTASHKWDAALEAKETAKNTSNVWWQGAGNQALATFAKAPMEAASRGVRLRDDPYQPGEAALSGTLAKLGELPRSENKYQYMSGAERQIYNFWQDRDPEAAKDYLTMLEPQLDRRNADAIAKDMREEARANPAAGVAQNIAGSYFSPLSLAASAVQNIKNAVTGEAMPAGAYSTVMMGAVMTQASQTGLLDRVDSKIGKQILSTALSVAQVASRLPLGAVGLPFMAASAGGQTAQQAAAQGKSASDVLALGLQTAVTEYLTEKLPFDQLLKASKTGGSIAWTILKTAASEGLEEWANDYMNTLGNNLILGSESEMQQAVKELMTKGMSQAEAQKQVAKEYLVWRPLQSALGGAMAGGAVGGGSAAFGNYSMSKTGAQLREAGAVEGTLAKGLASPEGATQSQVLPTPFDTSDTDEGIANLKKLALVMQYGKAYTKKGTDILNKSQVRTLAPVLPGSTFNADRLSDAELYNTLWRTAFEKESLSQSANGQSQTVPPWSQGYGPQTAQSTAGPVPAIGSPEVLAAAAEILGRIASARPETTSSSSEQLNRESGPFESQSETAPQLSANSPNVETEGKGETIVGSNYDKIKPTQDIVNSKKVEEYAKRLRAGEKIPPVQVIEVPGKGQYIINGHHRYVASLQTGIPVEIKVVQNQGPIGMPDWSGVQWKEYISEEQFWDD